MSWGRRRRALSTEEIEANRLAKAKREADAMTCQVCGRKILANTGTIAHHGYTRPWEGGYQTASCYGAKAVPFEVARDTLKLWIKILEDQLAGITKKMQAVLDETSGMLMSYQKSYGRLENATIFVLTRAGFEQAKIDHPLFFRYKSQQTFDEIKNQWLASEEWKRLQLIREIEKQKKRYAAWKETHYFAPDKKWEKWERPNV